MSAPPPLWRDNSKKRLAAEDRGDFVPVFDDKLDTMISSG